MSSGLSVRQSATPLPARAVGGQPTAEFPRGPNRGAEPTEDKISMQIPIEQIESLLNERNLLALGKTIQARVLRLRQLFTQLQKAEAEFRAAGTTIQIHSVEGDLEGCANAVAQMQRASATMQKIQQELDDVAELGSELLGPVHDVSNAALAVAPALLILKKHFMEMPRTIRDELQNRTLKLKW